MNYKAHSVGGVCSGLAFSIATMPQENQFLYVSAITASSLLGSLLPDIDEPNSFIGKKVWLLSKLIKFTTGHRGVFHTLAIVLIFPLIYFLTKDNEIFLKLSWFPYKNFIIGLIIGYLSHLLMDSMTEMGVPLLWPLTKEKISIMKLRTNRHEWIAIFLFVLLVIVVAMVKHQEVIKLFAINLKNSGFIS